MKQPTIKILTKNYKIAFNYGTLRQLAKEWELNTPTQVEARVLAVMNKSATDAELSFEDIDVLRDLFYAAIETQNDVVPFTANAMMNYIMSTPGVLNEVTSFYIDSVPKPKEPVNPNARRIKKKQ